jgi:ElaA protein
MGMGKKAENYLWSILHFRDLSVQQLYDILALRTAVFVVEQNCPYQEVDEKDPSAYHVFAYSKGGELIAVSRVLPPGISYKEASLGRVAIKKSYRGKGLAHLLNEKTIAFIESHLKEKNIRISAQSHLKAFYEKHGFIQVSEEYLEDDIPHIEMLRSL